MFKNCFQPSLLFTTVASKAEMQYQAILFMNTLVNKDDDWLPQHPQVVTNLLKIWVSEGFQDRHKKIVRYKHMLCTSCNLVQVITRTTLAVQVITRTTEPYKL